MIIQLVVQCLDCLQKRNGQITIHTGALASTDNHSYTFLVDKQLLMQQSIVKGALIRCQLRSLVVPGWKPIWIRDRVRSPFEEDCKAG